MKLKIHKAISGIGSRQILCGQKIWSEAAFENHKVTCSKCCKIINFAENKTKTISGTSHFVSFEAAVKYYSAQHETPASVKIKLEEKSISIGEPKLKPGQKLLLNKEEGRYFIEG